MVLYLVLSSVSQADESREEAKSAVIDAQGRRTRQGDAAPKSRGTRRLRQGDTAPKYDIQADPDTAVTEGHYWVDWRCTRFLGNQWKFPS